MLPNVQNEEVVFEPTLFKFKGSIAKPVASYDYAFELFAAIVPNDGETKYAKLGRCVQLTLRKKDSRVWWPRLAKTQAKLHNVQINWAKWIDDDNAPTASEGDDEAVELPNTADAEMTSSGSDDEPAKAPVDAKPAADDAPSDAKPAADDPKPTAEDDAPPA
jgi:prostaglandin-E synthase